MSSLIPNQACTASQIAKLWNKTPATIISWIERGVGKKRKRLKAIRLGGRWCVTPEAAAEFLSEETTKTNRMEFTKDRHRRNRVMELLGESCQ